MLSTFPGVYISVFGSEEGFCHQIALQTMQDAITKRNRCEEDIKLSFKIVSEPSKGVKCVVKILLKAAFGDRCV